ncbi:MAG TPA: ABC transporter substrate-binding protein [Methylomirabilota bacterium]|nr:ABC transporter substrate-binding protein [Methylomirabilota bacterium]
MNGPLPNLPAALHFVGWLRRAALLVVVAALAAGCAGGPPESGPVTLVFKHAKILGPSDPVPALLREFERRHPGVRVQPESMAWNSDDQHQFFVINLEGRGAAFDVMMLDVVWVAEFARAGWLLDLSPWVQRAELTPHFPSTIEPATWNGGVWAMPWLMNVGVLYYRTDLLAKYRLQPPKTWEALVDQTVRVRGGEKDPRLDGIVWQGRQYEGLTVNALEAIWANGARVFGKDGGVFPDEQRAAGGLALLRALIVAGVSPSWVTAADEEQSRRHFGDGRAVFLRNWPYAMDLFQAAGSPVRGRVGIAPLPGRVGGAASAASSGGAHLGVNRRTRHPALAAEFVRYMASAEAQRAMTLGGALNPTRMTLYHDPAVVRVHPDFPVVHDLMLRARPRPVTPAYLMLSTTLQPEFSAVLVGVKPPLEAIQHARARVEYLLAGLE